MIRVVPILGVVLLLAGWAPAAAQGMRVQAYIQPAGDISETQSVNLVIQAEGAQQAGMTPPKLGGLKNLQVVAGPAQGSEVRWVNGRTTAKTTLTYTLLPKGPGPAEIPALSLEVDGRPYTTQPIRFDVSQAPAGVPPPRPSRERSGASSGGDRADVFLRSQIGADEVWVGQTVPLIVSVYSAERISQPSMSQEPSLASFWVEDLRVDPQAESYRTSVEGRAYTVFPMVHRVLVPQTSGEFEIEPFVMEIPVRRRGGDDPFDFFRLGRTQSVVRKSQPLTLKVRPLPVSGRPDDFSGAVGNYTMRVALDRQEAAVNDAVSLTATVEGEGFLRAVSPPGFEVPSDLKVFDPKVSSSSRSVQGKLISTKTWEWLLVPLTPGELKVPEIRFRYFDTTRGGYDELSGTPGALVVRHGGDAPESATARGDIRLQRRDLAFIKPLRGKLRQSSPRAHEGALFVALLLLPVAWVPLTILAGRHRARLQQNLGLARGRRAGSRARKRLRSIGRRIDEQDAATFHEEVARALVEYVADRFDRSASGLTYELADELLDSRGVDADLRSRYRACLETCDFARYVSAAGSTARRAEVLSEAEQLLEAFEKMR